MERVFFSLQTPSVWVPYPSLCSSSFQQSPFLILEINPTRIQETAERKFDDLGMGWPQLRDADINPSRFRDGKRSIELCKGDTDLKKNREKCSDPRDPSKDNRYRVKSTAIRHCITLKDWDKNDFLRHGRLGQAVTAWLQVIEVCVLEGSTSAEHLCGHALLHHPGFLIRF